METIISDNESKLKHVDTKHLDQRAILSRRNSYQSIGSSIDELKFEYDQNNEIEIPEICSSGDVSISIYSSYFSAGGSSKKLFFFYCLYVFSLKC